MTRNRKNIYLPISGISHKGLITFRAVTWPVGAVDVLIILGGLRERFPALPADQVPVTVCVVGANAGLETDEGTLVATLVATLRVLQEDVLAFLIAVLERTRSNRQLRVFYGDWAEKRHSSSN